MTKSVFARVVIAGGLGGLIAANTYQLYTMHVQRNDGFDQIMIGMGTVPPETRWEKTTNQSFNIQSAGAPLQETFAEGVCSAYLGNFDNIAFSTAECADALKRGENYTPQNLWTLPSPHPDFRAFLPFS